MKAGTGEEKWMGGDRRDVQRGESWGEMRGRQGDWYVHCVQKKTPTHILFHISMKNV